MEGIVIDAKELFLQRRTAHENPLQSARPIFDSLEKYGFDEEALELHDDCERLLAEGLASDELYLFALQFLEQFNTNLFIELTSTDVTIGI